MGLFLSFFVCSYGYSHECEAGGDKVSFHFKSIQLFAVVNIISDFSDRKLTIRSNNNPSIPVHYNCVPWRDILTDLQSKYDVSISIFKYGIIVNDPPIEAVRRYSDIGSKEITREEYLVVIESIAVKTCEVNAKDYNFPKNECREYVISKTDDCISKINIDLPELITNKIQVKGALSKYLMCSTPAPGYARANDRNVTPIPASMILDALSGHFLEECQTKGVLTIEYTNPVSCKSKSIGELKEMCLEAERPQLEEKISCRDLTSDLEACKRKIKVEYPDMVDKEGSGQLAKELAWCLVQGA